MIFLKAIILLLVTNVLVQCSFKDHKVEETLKKVGKRLYVNFFGIEFGTPPKQMFKVNIKSLTVPENWDNITAEEVNQIKTDVVKSMGDDIYGNYLSDAYFAYYHQVNFLAVLSDEVVVELCDTGVKMNKYQFTKYIQRDIFQYPSEVLDDDNSYDYKLYNNDDSSTLNFVQTMNLKSRWDYKIQQVWKVTAKLKETNVGKQFRITQITIGGACFDFGSINHNYTEVEHSEHGLMILEKESNPDIQTLTNAFTDGPEYADRVPVKWLDGLVENEKNLTITVCTHKYYIPTFLREYFLAWYEKFSIMWHPVRNGTEDFLRVQVIEAIPGDWLSARITMRLQCGSDVNSTDIFDWDFKVKTKYNEHGDGKWYIKRLEVMCPVNYDPLIVNLRHIRDVVTKELLAPVDNELGTTPWYATVDYIRKFTKDGKLETYFCDTETTSNLTKLQLDLYFNRERRTGVIYNYVVDYEYIPHPPEEDSYFWMSTETYIKQDPPKKPALYKHDWKFILNWNLADQFYYISKLEISCPKVFGDPGTNFNIKIPL